MNLTNEHSIPQAIVDAIANDTYSRGDANISVSQLVQPPRLVALYEQHKDSLVEDASEKIWLLLGKAMHAVLEAAGQDALKEERLFTDVFGWKVSGAFDSLTLEGAEGPPAYWKLTDWKVTSAWTRYYGDRLEEWEKQLNLYAYLLSLESFTVESISVGAIYRDWSARDAARVKGYPQIQAEEIPLTLWSDDAQQEYMLERVMLHQDARRKLPDCSPEERWDRGKGSIRCKSYCPVRTACDFGIAVAEGRAQ